MDTKKKGRKSSWRSNSPSESPDSSSTIVSVPKKIKIEIRDSPNTSTHLKNTATSENSFIYSVGKKEDLFPFTEDSGPISSLTNESKPIDFFNLFIDSTLLSLMVCETNKNAEHLINAGEISQGSRMKAWRPVTLPEMKAFIAVLLEMGITRRSTIISYWTENSRNIPWFSKMFSRNRFQRIFQSFHLVDNDECLSPAHEKYDPSVKFMPIIEHANRVFKMHYKPHKELSIDEYLVGTPCHSSVMQNTPNRNHNRWGIKFWMLRDAVSKYCLGFYCYQGAKSKTDNTKPREHGLGYDVVMSLLEENQYLNKGHHLFVDNYFSSIALAKYLHSKDTYLTGAIKSNSKGVPSDIKTPSIDEPKYVRDEEVILCGYRENKSIKRPLLLISTYASDANTIETKKRNGIETSRLKPCIANYYNRYMGGVDESDKILYVYLDERCKVKYWKKVTFNIMARMILNSYVLYEELTDKKPMTRLEFTSSIISDIEDEWMRFKKQPMMKDDDRMFGLMKLPGRNLRQCVVCSSKATGIKRSNLICVQCKRGLHPLCLHNHVCFKNNESDDL